MARRFLVKPRLVATVVRARRDVKIPLSPAQTVVDPPAVQVERPAAVETADRAEQQAEPEGVVVLPAIQVLRAQHAAVAAAAAGRALRADGETGILPATS